MTIVFTDLIFNVFYINLVLPAKSALQNLDSHFKLVLVAHFHVVCWIDRRII